VYGIGHLSTAGGQNLEEEEDRFLAALESDIRLTAIDILHFEIPLGCASRFSSASS
jgi:hypothetical protein